MTGEDPQKEVGVDHREAVRDPATAVAVDRVADAAVGRVEVGGACLPRTACVRIAEKR
jgi:hypothetical protein